MPDEEERPYDAGEPKDVRRAIRAAQRWDDRKRGVIISVMSSEDGRRWLRDTLTLAHIGTNPFNRDPIQMAFNCGEANVGQRLMAELMNASPQLYMQMMAEAENASTILERSDG